MLRVDGFVTIRVVCGANPMAEYWIEYALGRSNDAYWMPTLAAGYSLQTFVADIRKTHGMDAVRVVVVDPLTLKPLPGSTWLAPGCAVRVLIETLA